LTQRVLCRFDDLAENEARAFETFEGSRRKAFVVRRNGRLFAWWDSCPHQDGSPMAWRTNAYLNAARDRIVCASHGAEFDIETGHCLRGAALGLRLDPAPIEATPDRDVIFKT
jgi:nitrite reductase/ring-hydroxylating ferredoxin subunit